MWFSCPLRVVLKYVYWSSFCISAGQKIPGVYARPVTRAQKLENLQLCMSFMGNRNINLQGIYVGGKEHFLVAILICCFMNSKGNCVKTLLFLIEFLLVSILVMAFFLGGGEGGCSSIFLLLQKSTLHIPFQSLNSGLRATLWKCKC